MRALSQLLVVRDSVNTLNFLFHTTLINVRFIHAIMIQIVQQEFVIDQKGWPVVLKVRFNASTFIYLFSVLAVLKPTCCQYD